MEDELSGSLFIFELLGLQYFSLKTINQTSLKSKFEPTCRLVYMFFLLVLLSILVAAFLVGESSLIIGSVTAKTVMMFAVKNSMSAGFILVVFTSLIQSYMSTEKTKKIYLNTQRISVIFQEEFDVFIDFKKIKNLAWKRLALSFVLFTMFHGSVGLFQMKYKNDIYAIFIGAIPLLFFLCIVYKLVFYIDFINLHLEFLDQLISDIEILQPIKIIDNINFHLLSVKAVRPTKFPKDSLQKFMMSRKIYNLIYDNGTLINSSNGLVVLMMLVSSVVTLTASGYEAFVIIVGGLPTKKIPGIIVMDCKR